MCMADLDSSGYLDEDELGGVYGDEVKNMIKQMAWTGNQGCDLSQWKQFW